MCIIHQILSHLSGSDVIPTFIALFFQFTCLAQTFSGPHKLYSVIFVWSRHQFICLIFRYLFGPGKLGLVTGFYVWVWKLSLSKNLVGITSLPPVCLVLCPSFSRYQRLALPVGPNFCFLILPTLRHFQSSTSQDLPRRKTVNGNTWASTTFLTLWCHAFLERFTFQLSCIPSWQFVIPLRRSSQLTEIDFFLPTSINMKYKKLKGKLFLYQKLSLDL